MADPQPRSLAPWSRRDGLRLRVLHVVLTAGETSAPYNEHCLAFASRHDIAVCSFFAPTLVPPPAVRLFGGDNSVGGFFRALRRALAAGPYDIVHAHAPHVALGLLTHGLWRLQAATVFTVHTSYPNVKARNRLMMVPAFLRFDQIVCCSEASLNSLPRLFRRLAGKRIAVVRNGVDVGRIVRVLGEGRRAERDGRFTVVAVGRLIPLKDPLGVVTAFREVAQAGDRLVFIGEGPLHGAVRQRSRECGLEEQVELTGLIARDAVYERLAAADLFVSASSVEGLPVAVLEAMACGAPAVLSDIPPHREIAAGVDFIPLVTPGDVAGFAREIRRFQRLSREQRAAIGARCRALVLENFGVERMGDAYQRVYGRALGRRRAPPGGH